MSHVESMSGERRLPHRALIAGYSPEQAASTTTILESLGYEVKTAESGDDVLGHCRQNPPEIVLLDLNIATGAGMGWIRDLRRSSGRLPKVIFSAPSYALESIWQALGLGVHEYILRPFDRFALAAKLTTVGLDVTFRASAPK